MPHEVPRRVPAEFTKDSPITEIGLYQAKLTGMGLKQQGISIQHVYCSPALRCVQTADAILDGLQADHTVTLKLENGLYEWLAWCHGKLTTLPTNTIPVIYKHMRHEKSKIPFSYMLYAYSVKEPIGELNLKRALDEDTGVFSSFFSLLSSSCYTVFGSSQFCLQILTIVVMKNLLNEDKNELEMIGGY